MLQITDYNNQPIKKDHELLVFKDMKGELQDLLKLCKDDYQSIEATTEKEELKKLLEKTNPHLFSEDTDVKLINRATSMIFRGWLAEYKGRGYILHDIGNGYFSYLCTAEEALVGVHYNNFESEY